jgi:hypothetical protein
MPTSICKPKVVAPRKVAGRKPDKAAPQAIAAAVQPYVTTNFDALLE